MGMCTKVNIIISHLESNRGAAVGSVRPALPSKFRMRKRRFGREQA